MVAALLSAAGCNFTAALIHPHVVPGGMLLRLLLQLVAVRLSHAADMVLTRPETDVQTGGLSLVIKCEECHTGNYGKLNNMFFHGLCFLFVSCKASCPVH